MFEMKQEVKARSELIQRIIFIIYCLFCAGIMIAFSIIGYAVERASLGILFLLASVFHISEFHHYNKNKAAGTIYFALSIIGITLGVWSLVDGNLDLWLVALIFGIMDVVSGAFEIFTNAVVLKKPFNSRSNITEYAVSTADIIFGILLIIHRENGLTVHIIYLAVVFLINAAVAMTHVTNELGKHE